MSALYTYKPSIYWLALRWSSQRYDYECDVQVWCHLQGQDDTITRVTCIYIVDIQ